MPYLLILLATMQKRGYLLGKSEFTLSCKLIPLDERDFAGMKDEEIVRNDGNVMTDRSLTNDL